MSPVGLKTSFSTAKRKGVQGSWALGELLHTSGPTPGPGGGLQSSQRQPAAYVRGACSHCVVCPCGHCRSVSHAMCATRGQGPEHTGRAAGGGWARAWADARHPGSCVQGALAVFILRLCVHAPCAWVWPRLAPENKMPLTCPQSTGGPSWEDNRMGVGHCEPHSRPSCDR